MRYKLFMLMFIGILLIGTISAADLMSFDNYKRFEKAPQERYGTIEIIDTVLFGEDRKLMDFTLLENTDQCLINCKASGTLTLYEEGKPITRTQFKDILGETSILEYKFFIKENISREVQELIYVEECNEIMNNKSERENVCIDVLNETINKTVWEEKWIQYSGKDYDAGTYEWKLEAKKELGKSVDWVVTSFGMDLTEFAWWDNDWAKKRQIEVNTTEIILNASLLINVTFDSDMQSDFDDLRFLDSTETTELGFWFYNNTFIASNSVEVWINISQIDPAFNLTIFMYYDNPAVSTTSDIETAFIFGENCDSTLDYTNKWQSSSETLYDCVGGNIHMNSTTAVNLKLSTQDKFGDYILETRVKTDVVNNDGFYFLPTEQSASTFGGTSNTGTLNDQFRIIIDGNQLSGGTSILNTYYRFNIKLPSGADEVVNITSDNGNQIFSRSRSPANSNGFIGFLRFTDTSTADADWIYIRGFANEEPTYFIGAEQENTGVQAIQSEPQNSFTTSNVTVDLSCNFTSSGITNISNVTILVYDSLNVLDYTDTDTSPGGLVDSFNKTWTTTALTDDNYNWSCNVFGNDLTFDQSGNRTFTLDATPPVINLTAPTGDQGSFVIGDNLSLNWTASDLNLDSCLFQYNNINTSVTCADNNFSFITVSGQQSIIFYANDTFGNLASNTTSWTYSFLENNVTFNAEVFETSNQDFALNLTTDETILSISGVMNYDSIDYLSIASCDGQTCILSNNIDIPLVDSGLSDTNNFFWNFTIFNGTSSSNVQTSTRQQIVNKTFLEICGGSNLIDTLNFTAIDEINRSRINNFQFDSTFEFWIGTGDVRRNTSYSTNGTEVNLCMRDDLEYTVDAIIDYDEFGNTTTYVSRFYYFDNHSINSTIQDISLALLQSQFSTSFILKVQDQNLLPVEDALITTQRCYADEPECVTVQIANTDENGKSIGFFQTETVDYKFIITKGGEILLETGRQKIIPETSPFTLTFNIGQDLGEPWAGQNEIPNVNSSLTFDKTSGIVTYVYIDSSGNFTNATLNVTRNSLSNSSATVIICNEISSLSSSTIFCDVGNTTGFYTASGFITRSGTALDKQISFQIEDISSIVGQLGLFFGFFLILVAMFMFKFNEIAGIWITVVTITLINITGLIKFGGVFVTAIIVLAIIITWLLER